MKCPVCKDVDLKIAERHGIEIDYCAKCRGVWLDRGELDKIIERSARLEREFEAPQARPLGDIVDDDGPFYDDYDERAASKRKNKEKYRREDDDDRRRHDDDDQRHTNKRRRRKSFFEEIFDEIFD